MSSGAKQAAEAEEEYTANRCRRLAAWSTPTLLTKLECIERELAHIIRADPALTRSAHQALLHASRTVDDILAGPRPR